ncbi:hypothetical protein F5X97DRAFT_58318 [Nemania serpens]|nr:hypothetical protein F5X97DRAFT_58318 [Nemania serpens]
MPKSRTPSTGSGSGTAESVGKSSIGSSVGSILSRVLGSFRRLSRDDDEVTANSKEDATKWASTFKITHRPDRPRHDKREDLRHRNSVYVLAQLRRIWQHNEKMTETKRTEREARAQVAAAAAASGFDDERDRRPEGNGDSNIGHRSRPRAPTLQTDLMPNFSRKGSSPEIARSKWRTEGEEVHRAVNRIEKQVEQHGRLAYSPSSPDQMTIRVGMVQSPYGGEERGGLKTAPGRAEDGGRSHAQNNILATSSLAPRPPPISFTPSVVPPMRSAPPFPSSGQTREAARAQQMRGGPHWSRTDKNAAAHPANAMQTSTSARGKTLPQTMTSVYINAGEDSTPSLVQNSSPVSEAASPATPTDPLFDHDDDGNILSNREVPPTEPHTSKTCPLCGKALQTATDRQQNLCIACRNELQPRQSIFTTDVLNPFPYSRPPTNTRTNPRISLFPTIRQNPTAGAGAARPNKPAETLRNLNGEGKHARTGSGTTGDHQSADGIRGTETLPPSSSSSPTKKKMKKASDAGPISSRFNKDRRDFTLQPAPLSRKHAQRGQRPQLDDLSPSLSPPLSVSPPAAPTEHQRRDGSDDAHGRNHIGYQLAGWPSSSQPQPQPQSVPPSPPPILPPPPVSAPQAPPSETRPGPLLEPKTFRPVTKKDAIVIPRRKPSGSRARFKGRGAAANGGGQAQHRTHVERTGGVRKGSSLRSPGHRRKRHQQPLAQGASVPRGKAAASDDAATAAAAAASKIDRNSTLREGDGMIDNEDIYREIDNIIDSYLWRPDMSKSDHEKRKSEAVASYFTEVPFDVEMRLRGFF